MEVNKQMPFGFGSNLAMSVANTLILAFFVVCAIGVAAGVYAARALKRAEQSSKKVD
jgi:ABC-type antimicrobial peptide transport system permease subunit